jgi:hypothetical protein
MAAGPTLENFDLAKKEFIAAHATEQDRNELVQQLMHPVKPRSSRVQAFLQHLFELNEAVVLLPGEAAALTAQQVKQAFYDGIPAARKQRLFIQAVIHNWKNVGIPRTTLLFPP